MVYALLLAKSAQGIKLEYLKSVLLGGTAVTPELMRLCTEELGAHGIENAYGMTEGVFCTSGNQKPEALLNGSDVAVGRVQAGGRLKVCAPGSKVPLPCGQAGELHGSLPTTVRSYIGNPSEDFYEEHGHHWFRSGDQAVMDTDGRIFVVGRYKEMIIRGGENIAPAAIEACIYRELPQFKDRQVQIIGVADEIAGEVPLAIVAKPVDAEATKQIKDTVVSNMGTMYSIDDIIYIGDLGLEDYPRTMGQKVQKNKLTELVRTYRQRSDVSNDGLPNSQANSKLTEQVKQIWARTVGIEPADITLATDVSEFVDSITLMRVKDKLYKQTGINMTVQEILQARTIGKVINVMQSRAVTTVADENARFKPPDHAPTMDDMVHIFGDPVIYEATKAVITKAIKPHGLSWEDVRDVMPAYDFTELAFKNGTLERWAFKAAILANNCTIKVCIFCFFGLKDLGLTYSRTCAQH